MDSTLDYACEPKNADCRFGAEADKDVSETSAALLQLGRKLRENGYRFTTVTPATHARVNSRPGNQEAHDLSGIFGWSRRFDPSTVPADMLALMKKAEIVETADGKMKSRVRASTIGDTLYFHSAYPTVDPDSVFFGPDTYRFVSAIRQHLLAIRNKARSEVYRAIEICCGAAPGAITIAQHHPDAEVLATDINGKALRLAEINSNIAGTLNVRACYSNLLQNVEGGFDLIVANPPYLVDPALRAYRHGGGLYGDGLSLDILSASLTRLNPGGTLLLYTGSAIIQGRDLFLEAAEKILSREQVQAQVRWRYREIDPDVFGEELLCEAYREADRIAAVMLEVTLDR